MKLARVRTLWLDVVVAIALTATVTLGLVRAGEPVAGGSLSGTVTAVKGTQPYTLPGLPDVAVKVQPGGYTATTDRSGRFTLALPPGTYEVTLSGAGLESATQKVMVPAAGSASLNLALFPAPAGPPMAALKRSGRGPIPPVVPYNTTVYVDAGDSRNISRAGIRWEVRDADGRLVEDPFAPGRPLQLEPSPIPGSSPLEYTFTPPRPGRFTVRLSLTNQSSSAEPATAELVVVAENAPPEALPGVLAGPAPGGRAAGQEKPGRGLTTVPAGRPVYLAGWALDKNMPSPELYNPGGRAADPYGKNDDWRQRQFAWNWRLEYQDATGQRTDVTSLLRAGGSDRDLDPTGVQYPFFTPTAPGRYTATLVVHDRDPFGSLASEPAQLSLLVLASDRSDADEATCRSAECHPSLAAGSTDKPAGGMPCQACHGPGQPHLAASGTAEKRASMAVSYDAAQCGQCHGEYREWSKARHSDGYAFGYYEVAQPLMLNCAKCHYPQGFADAMSTAQAKKVSFGQVVFKKPLFPGGPLFFDFDKLPEKRGQGVACQSCHDPHQISTANPYGLRASKSQLCGTCHEEKWQNVLLEQTAGQLGSAYEYPGERYDRDNPHATEESCVLCHMDTSSPLKDAAGVRELGGHTFRMRSAGPDGLLGGFGPAPEDPARLREKAPADDELNLAPCRRCHPDATTFNYRGRQAEVYQLWRELGDLLKERNGGRLPGYKPGDKCATCHRGGTLPFDNDPNLVLENAYTNYKLVMNDRSWGIHNYRYTVKLLADSIRSVKQVKP